MKHTSLLMLAATLVASSAQAQSFVTGFDYNNIDESNTVGDRNANFGTVAARNYFTLYTEHSSFASDTDPYSGQVANAGSGWWQAGDDLGGGFGTAGLATVHTVRGSQAGNGAIPGAFTQGNVVNAGNALHFTGAVNGGWFTYGIDAGGDGFSMIEDLRVDFQFKALDETFNVEQNWWLIDSANAGDIATGDFSNASLSGSFDPTLDYAEWMLDLGDVSSGSFLVFGVSTTNTDAFAVGPDTGIYYDNVTFNGTAAIPEPSTHAIIAGLMVLGIAGWRRRLKA